MHLHTLPPSLGKSQAKEQTKNQVQMFLKLLKVYNATSLIGSEFQRVVRNLQEAVHNPLLIG